MMPDASRPPTPEETWIELAKELRRELRHAQDTARALRVAAVLALIAAAFAAGTAVWAGARADAAGARAERVARDLVELREREEERADQRALRAARHRPLPHPSPSAEGGAAAPSDRAGPWEDDMVLLELDGLDAHMQQLEGRVGEVENGMVAWGREAKSYVDQRLQQALAQRGLQREGDVRAEISELWVRLGVVEQRVGVR